MIFWNYQWGDISVTINKLKLEIADYHKFVLCISILNLNILDVFSLEKKCFYLGESICTHPMLYFSLYKQQCKQNIIHEHNWQCSIFSMNVYTNIHGGLTLVSLLSTGHTSERKHTSIDKKVTILSHIQQQCGYVCV